METYGGYVQVGEGEWAPAWVTVGRITDLTDILGNTRFIDGNGDGTASWDIGAYDFNSFKRPRFSIAPQRTSQGWMGAHGATECPDGATMGWGAMFYRVAVP